ncbi:MAG: SDR family oxidoreductase [Candidatus Sumerlaeia bacterium]|nr:SDR family oxidoreductase [Candidatus Sumerlaeia bacterium]
MHRLSGKIALITGASRGIGEAIARAFHSEGATVYLSDINDNQGLAVAQSLGTRAFYTHLDVRKEEDWRSVLSRIESASGPLSILVNNAGITGFEEEFLPQDPEHTTLQHWRSIHETNLDGVFLGCKYAIGSMRKNAGIGSIINMSSRSGLVGIPGAVAYASSKAAIRNHTKSVALYCAEQKLAIRCNSIHPAAILTPMWEPLLGDGPDREERIQEFVRDCPLKRFGKPEEVAALAVLLASDEATYINGAEFNIDGGTLAGSIQFNQ